MATNGNGNSEVDEGLIDEVFDKLALLERKYADVELDAVRSREFALKPLYLERQTLLDRLPGFWSVIFAYGPERIQRFISAHDTRILMSVKSFFVERYQIKSETEGEPRSLRFTFDFAPNEYLVDTKLVKEFEYQRNKSGFGHLVSKPVPIKWKKGKDPTNGILDAAVELHAAEETLKLKLEGREIDVMDRENLWQYAKLQNKLVEIDEDSDEPPSFFAWFGFRGAVGSQDSDTKGEGKDQPEHNEDGDDEESDYDDELIDVEIHPDGEDLANALADDYWPNVMDFFVQSESEHEAHEESESEGEESDDIPDLVPATGGTTDDARPQKRQRVD